jgi:hypothetical protein
MCDRSHLAPGSGIKELRARAKRRGYRLLRKRGRYELRDSDGVGPGSEDLDGIAFWLDYLEGKFEVTFTTLRNAHSGGHPYRAGNDLIQRVKPRSFARMRSKQIARW